LLAEVLNVRSSALIKLARYDETDELCLEPISMERLCEEGDDEDIRLYASSNDCYGSLSSRSVKPLALAMGI